MYRDNITLPQPHMLKQAVVLRILFYFIFKEQSIEDKSKQWKVSFKIWKHLHFYCIFMGKSLQNLTWIIWYSTSNHTTNGEPSPLQINFPHTKIHHLSKDKSILRYKKNGVLLKLQNPASFFEFLLWFSAMSQKKLGVW